MGWYVSGCTPLLMQSSKSLVSAMPWLGTLLVILQAKRGRTGHGCLVDVAHKLLLILPWRAGILRCQWLDCRARAWRVRGV